MDDHQFDFSKEMLKNMTCCCCGGQFHVLDFNNLEGSKLPILLECMHTTCANCLKNNKKTVPKSCRHCEGKPNPTEEFNMNALGILAVAKSTRKKNLMENQNSMKKEKDSDKICGECGFAATLGCKQCKAVFCKPCWSLVHEKSKVLSKHEKLDPERLSVASQTEKCKKHNHANDVICLNCNLVACMICMYEDHSGHETKPLCIYNESILPDMKKAVAAVQQHVTAVENTLKTIRNERCQIGNCWEPTKVKKDVVDYFQKIHSIVQMQQKKALLYISSHTNPDSAVLLDFEQQLQAHLENIQQQLKMSQQLLKRSESKMSYLHGGNILNCLEQSLNVPCYLVKQPVDSSPNTFNIFLKEDIFSLLDNLVSYDVSEHKPKFQLVTRENLSQDFNENLAGAILLNGLKNSESDVDDAQPSASNASASTRSSSSSQCESTTMSDVESQNVSAIYGTKAFHVEISHVVGLHKFYVYVGKDKETLANSQPLINEAARNSQQLHSIYTGESVYVADDGKWHRGIVKKIHEDESDVHFIDYGWTKKVSNDELRARDETNWKEAATRCHLHQTSQKFTCCSLEFRNILTLENIHVLLKAIKQVRNIIYVDVFIDFMDDYTPGRINLKDYLFKSNQAKLSKGPYTKLQYTFPNVNKFAKENSVKVTNVISPHYFYVQTEDQQEKYKVLREKLTEIYSKIDIRKMLFVPQIDMPCAVQTFDDKTWHRGIVVADSKGKPCVKLVDFGRRLPYSFVRCLRLHKYFLNEPHLVYKASLAEVNSKSFQTWPREQFHKFKTILLNKILRVKLYSTFRRTLYVHAWLPDETHLNAMFKNDGLASLIIVANSEDNLKPKPESKSIATAASSESESAAELSVILKNKPTVADVQFPELSDYPMEVNVIKIESPERIYLSKPDYDANLQKISLKIKENCISCLERWKNWHVGDIAVFYSSSHKNWYRGEIVAEMDDDELYTVFVFDIIETIKLSWKVLQNNFDIGFERLIFQCQLVGVAPFGNRWPCQAADKLREILISEKIYIFKKGEINSSVIPAELFIKKTIFPNAFEPAIDTYQSVNKIFSQMPLTKTMPGFAFGLMKGPEEAVIPEDELPDLPKEWLPSVPINKKSVYAKITFVDHRSVCYFYDIDSDYEKMIQMRKEIREMCDQSVSRPNEIWKENDLCFARFRGEYWYRGRIVKTNIQGSGQHLVEFVDYGNLEVVGVLELLRANAYFDVPILSHTCYLQDYETADLDITDQTDYLYNFLVDSSCYIHTQGNVEEPFPAKFSLKKDNVNLIHAEIQSGRLVKRKEPFILTKRDFLRDYDAMREEITIVPAELDIEETSQEDSMDDWSKMVQAQVQYDNLVSWNKKTLQYECNKMEKITIVITGMQEDVMYGVLAKEGSLTDNLKKVRDEFFEFNDQLNKESHNLQKLLALTDCKDAICIAKKNESFMRVVIQSISDGTVLALLIDHGGMGQFSFDQLYFCQKEWAELPGMVIAMKLEGVNYGDCWPLFLLNAMQTGHPTTFRTLKADDQFLYVAQLDFISSS